MEEAAEMGTKGNVFNVLDNVHGILDNIEESVEKTEIKLPAGLPVTREPIISYRNHSGA